MNITILGPRRYRINEPIPYHSPRYGKTSTAEVGEYDGATGADDILTLGWVIHDQLCREGCWDDGTLIYNWQCSQVLQDILKSEGRWFRARTWFAATFLFGGGQARKNGMWS